MFNLSSWCNTIANWADLVAAKAPNVLAEAATVFREAAEFFKSVGFECTQDDLTKCLETQAKLDNCCKFESSTTVGAFDFSKIKKLIELISLFLKFVTPTQPTP